MASPAGEIQSTTAAGLARVKAVTAGLRAPATQAGNFAVASQRVPARVYLQQQTPIDDHRDRASTGNEQQSHYPVARRDIESTARLGIRATLKKQSRQRAAPRSRASGRGWIRNRTTRPPGLT